MAAMPERSTIPGIPDRIGLGGVADDAESGAPTGGLTRADVLRATDVAAMTGLSTSTIYDWARHGRLPCRRRGNVRIFLRSEVERWLLDPNADF